LKNFRNPDGRKASWQLVNTLMPYACLWYLMIRSIQLGYPYWLTVMLALPAAAFLVRIFILFHDCVHDSFFMSKRVNTVFGYLLGALVFTSFEDWRFSHLRHHGACANLDARGFGDIWTLTLKEYNSLPKSKQLIYRLYRNPVVLIGLGSFFTFLIGNRFPTKKVGQKERLNVLFINLLILFMVLMAAGWMGWQTYLLIQLPVLWFAGMAGIWLFYLQHQFPGGYWAHNRDWQPLRAAMEGSSFYKLPAFLTWFSGNIGYHHVHHLNPKIPNYRLRKCYDAVPALQAKQQLTLTESLACIHLKLWDEERQEMVAFS
jgi:omega-6 fatty acid desaturase (delta-12 desaturase)